MKKRPSATLSYVNSLQGDGRRTQLQALRVVASIILGRPIRRVENVAWHRMTYEDSARVREAVAKKYAPATANRMIAALRAVFLESWRLGLMDRDTYERAHDVRNIRHEDLGRGRALEDHELEAMYEGTHHFDGARGARNRAVLALLHYGGLRRGEVIRLQRSDLHLDRDELTVHGKGARQRAVFLGEGLVYLREWIATRGDTPGPLICKVEDGSLDPFTESGIYRLVTSLARDAGLAPATPHDLRRTCATRLLELSGDMLLVGQFLGHRKPETTKLYDKRGLGHLRKLQARMKVRG